MPVVQQTSQKVNVLGRERNVMMVDGEKKVTYHGRMIKLEVAKKWDASKKAKEAAAKKAKVAAAKKGGASSAAKKTAKKSSAKK